MNRYSKCFLLFLVSFICFSDVVYAAKEISDFQKFMYNNGIAFCFFLLFAIITILTLSHDEWNFGSQKESGEIRFSKKGNTLPDYKELQYFRDIPCNEDLSIAYWVALRYNIVSEAKLKKGLMGAIILKWLKEEKINIIKTHKEILSIKDNNYAIDLQNLNSLTDPTEKKFSKLLLEISGENKILEANEFKKWCYYNYNTLNSWFNDAEHNGLLKLKQSDFITTSIEKVNSKYGAKKTLVINNVTDNLWYEALKLKGLKKFLLYFTLMEEKEYFDVHIWEKYLIFSNLLDVSKKVKEQFGKLYPKLNGESVFDIDSVDYGLGLAELGYISFEKALEEQENKQ